MIIERFLDTQGIDVGIERNGIVLQTTKGLFSYSSSDHRKICSFPTHIKIKPSDWIIKKETGERFYVIDIESRDIKGKTEYINAFLQTAIEYSAAQKNTQQAIINIQNAYGSVIGTGNTATINYKNSIQDIKKEIEASETSDKEELKQIVSLLEMIINNQVPASKGLFSKFSEVMERNSWITGSIAGALLSWLTTQIP